MQAESSNNMSTSLAALPTGLGSAGHSAIDKRKGKRTQKATALIDPLAPLTEIESNPTATTTIAKQSSKAERESAAKRLRRTIAKTVALQVIRRIRTIGRLMSTGEMEAQKTKY